MDGRYLQGMRGNEGRRQELKCLSGYMAKKVVGRLLLYSCGTVGMILEGAGSMRVRYMVIYEFYSGIIFSQS
jgi:hypothetical protein